MISEKKKVRHRLRLELPIVFDVESDRRLSENEARVAAMMAASNFMQFVDRVGEAQGDEVDFDGYTVILGGRSPAEVLERIRSNETVDDTPAPKRRASRRKPRTPFPTDEIESLMDGLERWRDDPKTKCPNRHFDASMLVGRVRRWAEASGHMRSNWLQQCQNAVHEKWGLEDQLEACQKRARLAIENAGLTGGLTGKQGGQMMELEDLKAALRARVRSSGPSPGPADRAIIDGLRTAIKQQEASTDGD